MSGSHYRYESLRWPLEGFEDVEPGNPYAKAPTCVMADFRLRGWAFPPCVYTDDPAYDDQGGCDEYGACAYRFLAIIARCRPFL